METEEACRHCLNLEASNENLPFTTPTLVHLQKSPVGLGRCKTDLICGTDEHSNFGPRELSLLPRKLWSSLFVVRIQNEVKSISGPRLHSSRVKSKNLINRHNQCLTERTIEDI